MRNSCDSLAMNSQSPGPPFGTFGDDDDGEEMSEPPATAPGRLLLNIRQEVTWAQFVEIARVLKGEPPSDQDPDQGDDGG